MAVPIIVILPGLLGLAVLPMHLVPASEVHAGQFSYNEVLPLMLARYCGPDCWAWESRRWLRIYGGHGGERQRIRHGLDV